METFQVQLEDIAGAQDTPDTAAMSDWLTAGARTVLDVLSLTKIKRISSQDAFVNTVDVEGKKVLTVTRNDGTIDHPCREVLPSMRGRVIDSNYMEYASNTDPVFYIDNQLLTVKPDSSGSNQRLTFVNSAITVAYGESVIANFPDEAEKAVVLYAARNYIQRLMTDLNSNTLIDHASTGALALMNAEIDDVVHDSTGSLKYAKDEITAFYTSIADIDDTNELWDSTNKRFKVIKDALDQAQNLIDGDEPGAAYDAEANLADIDTTLDKIDAHLIDSEAILGANPASGSIFDALGLIKIAVDQAATAAGKFLTVDSDSVFGDEATFLTDDSQLTNVKQALARAKAYVNGDEPSSTTDAYGAQANEDVELVTSALNIVQTEITRAKMHLSEWVSIGDMRTKEVQVALNEADGYAKEIQARLAYAQSYIAAASARGQEGSARLAQLNGTLSVVAQELARANVAVAEVNTIMASYRLELEGVAPYLQEVQARLAAASSYGQEAQARIARDQVKYTWYAQQYQMIDAQYKEEIQILQGTL